jgi:hypothetical protein
MRSRRAQTAIELAVLAVYITFMLGLLALLQLIFDGHVRWH